MKIGLFLLGLLLGVSCSSLPEILHRDFKARTYQFAEEALGVSPVGKVSYKWCKKYKILKKGQSEYCTDWGFDYQDLCNAETHVKFRTADFVVIQRNRIK